MISMKSGNVKWSVMIPTFNCAKYLEKTLASVLAQDLGVDCMQIEVVDDCSTLDDPKEIVDKIAKGRVKFFRQQKNVGIVKNFNTCISRAKGDFVHILHGDDWVGDNFYNNIERVFLVNSNISAVFVRSFIVDELGKIENISPRVESLENPSNDSSILFYSNHILTPGVVVKKEFYEKYGYFDASFSHVTDWDMWIRVIGFGGAVFINQPNAFYRYFSSNDTSRLARNAGNFKEYLSLSQKLSHSYKNFNQKKFQKNVSYLLIDQINNFKKLGDKEAVAANYRFFLQVASIKTIIYFGVYSILSKFFSKFS